MRKLQEKKYSNSSRKQALCALIFVFRRVLRVDVGRLELPPAPREKRTLRTVPTRQEIARLFAGMRGQPRLMAALMYGAGLRVEETCTLRVKDVDFERKTIRIYSGKGDCDRLTLLPALLVPALQRHIAWRKALHEQDLAEGAGLVDLPGRLAVKYPAAQRSLEWQYLFPSTLIRNQRRWYAVSAGVQKAMRQATAAAGLPGNITPHTLRHAYATNSLQSGVDIATIQRLMGHNSVETTQIYLHADAARGVSPLDLGPLTNLG